MSFLQLVAGSGSLGRMLTIRAMAEMGLWTLTHIDVLDSRNEGCQRCKTRIRYVWVMEKQTEPKETWRIGSECGPNLEQMSQQLWDTSSAPFKTSVRHLATLERLVKWERNFPECRPYDLGWAEQQLAKIAAGGLTKHQQRVLGHHISQAEKKFRTALLKASAPRQHDVTAN